ncbi:MAG: ATP-dependent zinc metalloprotease FtsH [Patescibacteria group bacterium]
MKSLLKYILLIFVVLLVISSLIAGFSPDRGGKKEEISLSKLITQINEGSVKTLTVQGGTFTVELRDDKGKETVKAEPNAAPSETLKNLGADEAQLKKIEITIKEEGFFGYLPAIVQIVLPFLFIGLLFWFMFRSAQKGAMGAMNFGKSKARLAGTDITKKKVTFKDVAGLIEAKEEVVEIVEFLRDPTKFKRLGARMPRGFLLVGTPGTGKTLLAKAVANEANVPFYFVSGSEFVEMFVGVGATRVRDTFEAAKKNSPAIIFVDEIDAVGRHRGAGMGGGHDEREQTLNQILVEMDGFDTDTAVIVMAATNRPDILDPALLRPGRFDRRIILDEPSLKDREAILKIHAAEKPLGRDVNLRVVAERTPGFSGADLANLINEGAILAARKNQSQIMQIDILQAVEKVMLGPERKSKVMNPKEKEITAYHEAGHALVAVSVPHADPVHKVSIVSRGRAGGYTLKLPSEDRMLKTKSEFEAELAVLMGGYMAEQIVFKELTTGASNDLKVASDLAHRMVTEFGMSAKIGPSVFGEKDEMVFMGRDFGHQKNYSNEIAYQIDVEVKALLSKALKKAKEVITKKIEVLNRIAKELIAKETLEQKELYALIG